MIALACAAGAALSFGLAAHPFTTYPLSLRVLASRHRRPFKTGLVPQRIAMCVCAYNEQDVIRARIENMIGIRRTVPDLDILLYIDAASDATPEIAREYEAQIRLFVATERHGKSFGMNVLVSQTDADILVFSDANVRFADDALERLVAPFGDPGIGCVCGHLVYEETSGHSVTATTGSLYWRMEEMLKSLETQTGSVIGADGSIFSVRRALYHSPPPSLIDDMFVSLKILCAGQRVVRVADAFAYEATVSRPAEEFRRKIRISCQAFNVNRALWRELMRLPALDRYKYVSHKLLRWLTIYFLAAAVILGLVSIGLAFGGVAFASGIIAVAIGLAVIHVAKSGPLAKIREIMAAFLATGIGVWQSCRGATYQVWTPPASARSRQTPALAASGGGA